MNATPKKPRPHTTKIRTGGSLDSIAIVIALVLAAFLVGTLIFGGI